MNFMTTLGTMALTALLFTSCAGGKDNKSADAGVAGPTYTENEVVQDEAKLADLEKKLENLGFKFSVNAAGGTSWNDPFMMDHYSTQAEPDFNIITKALQDYSVYAKKFVAKYHTNFTLKYNDGRTEGKILMRHHAEQITNKAMLAEDTVTKLK